MKLNYNQLTYIIGVLREEKCRAYNAWIDKKFEFEKAQDDANEWLENHPTTNMGDDMTTSDIIGDTEDEYEKALKVLEQNEIIAKQMKYCPYCHSDNIEYALKKEKKIRALFATFLSLLTATPLKTEHWEYICKQCGKHFENPVA